LHNKLWASKVVEIQILGITGPWEKHHFGVAPKVNYREYYKKEGGGFP
jgi:hypothetical protein